jgi:hypothetical protein
MVRTQIQLTEEQHRQLKELAHRQGISLAEVVRRLIDEKLEHSEMSPTHLDRVRQALGVCGKYDDPSGDRNVAENHDRHLADAFSQ